jgi:hypothetical protein
MRSASSRAYSWIAAGRRYGVARILSELDLRNSHPFVAKGWLLVTPARRGAAVVVRSGSRSVLATLFHSSHGCWGVLGESFRLRFATLPLACLGHALLTRAKP